jgi:hypothetical protein
LKSAEQCSDSLNWSLVFDLHLGVRDSHPMLFLHRRPVPDILQTIKNRKAWRGCSHEVLDRSAKSILSRDLGDYGVLRGLLSSVGSDCAAAASNRDSE